MKIDMPSENLVKRKDTVWFALLAVVVLLTRLPFLFNGYGSEEDSWGLVLNSWDMIGSGHYVYSRLPGHPVQELVLLMMHDAGPFVFNFFSALFGTLAAIFFARILKLYSFRFPVLGGFALAFIPVFYISSTYTIDYCWALAFIMMSYYFLLKHRFPLAGTLLGIAVGCRLTSALMFIPFFIMLFELRGKDRLNAMIKFILFAAVAGLVVYLPALLQYGLKIFSTYPLPYPSVAKVAYKATIGVWGVVGILALVYALIITLKNSGKDDKDLYNENPGKIHLAAWLVAVILTCLIYFRLPEKSAFFIPALPFIIMFAGYLMKSKKAFIVFCILLIISPFLISVNLTDKFRGADHSRVSFTKKISGQEIFFDPIGGPVFSDYSKRSNKAKFTEQVAADLCGLKKRTSIITGWWFSQLKVWLHDHPCKMNFEILENAGQKELKEAYESGTDIYYLPGIDAENDQHYGMTFTKNYAKEFPADY